MFSSRVLLVALLGLMMGTVGAVPITLTYNDPISPGFSQTESSPMIIGNASQNPAGFDVTPIPSGGNVTWDLNSPTYTVGQLRGFFENVFSVQIDINQANDVQKLFLFSMSVDGIVEFIFDGGVEGVDLLLSANGTGESDASLTGFDLSSFADEQEVVFRAHWFSNDGFEQWFLHDEEDPDDNEEEPVVPEPATLALLGVGLALTGAFRRRS